MAKKKEVVPGTCSACVNVRCAHRKKGVICAYYVEKNTSKCGGCAVEIRPGDDYCIKHDGDTARVLCASCGAGEPMMKAPKVTSGAPGQTAPAKKVKAKPAPEAVQAVPEPKQLPAAFFDPRRLAPGQKMTLEQAKNVPEQLKHLIPEDLKQAIDGGSTQPGQAAEKKALPPAPANKPAVGSGQRQGLPPVRPAKV